MLLYWTEEDERFLETAETFEELSALAIKIIERMPKPIGQVCGPISTGGLGNVDDNVRCFKQTIESLRSSGLTIFNQMPFERPMWKIMKTPYYQGANHLLEGFYLPIFESGLISTLYFMKGWETSYGARWEHRQAMELPGIEIRYLM